MFYLDNYNNMVGFTDNSNYLSFHMHKFYSKFSKDNINIDSSILNLNGQNKFYDSHGHHCWCHRYCPQPKNSKLHDYWGICQNDGSNCMFPRDSRINNTMVYYSMHATCHWLHLNMLRVSHLLILRANLHIIHYLMINDDTFCMCG